MTNLCPPQGESGEIGYSELLRSFSVEKDWKSCESSKIGCPESILAASVGKDWRSCESNLFQVNLSYFGGKRLEKFQIG